MVDLQVSLAGGSKSLKLPIKGAGLAPKLTLNSHGTLHFGLVPTYEWADQLLQLVNSCSELPMQVAVDRSGPYFSAEPSELQLPPGASATVLLRYLPKVRSRCSVNACNEMLKVEVFCTHASQLV